MAATIFYDPVSPGEMPVRLSQALQLLSFLEEYTGEAQHFWLPWRVAACHREQGGQVKAGYSQGTELFSQHHTMQVEVWTLQHEVVDGFRDADAPRAVQIWGKAEAVEVSSKCCVANTEKREGNI